MAQKAPEKLDREIIVIASVVVVGAIVSILDTTIVNVALATLSRELQPRARVPADAWRGVPRSLHAMGFAVGSRGLEMTDPA